MVLISVYLRDFFLSLTKDQREEFAGKCGTTTGQIIQIYSGNRSCNPSLAINFDRESKGEVKCEELRPDVDFDYLRKKKSLNVIKTMSEKPMIFGDENAFVDWHDGGVA